MDELAHLIDEDVLATISKKLRVNLSKCQTKLENVRIHYPKKLKSIEGISDITRARVLLQLTACAFLDLHGNADPFKLIEKFTEESFIAKILLSSLGIAKDSPNKLLELLKLVNGSQSVDELLRIRKLGCLLLVSMHAARTETISNVFDRVSSVVTIETSLIQLGIDLGGTEKGNETHVLSLARSAVSRILAGNGKSEFEANRTWMIRFFMHQYDKFNQPFFSSVAFQVALDEVIETPEQFDLIVKVIRELQSQGAKLSSVKPLLSLNIVHSGLFNLIKGKCLADILAQPISAQLASNSSLNSKTSKLVVNEKPDSSESTNSSLLPTKTAVKTQRLPGFAQTSRKLDALHGRNAVGSGSSVTKVEPVAESRQAPSANIVQPVKEQSVPTVNKLKVALKARAKKG